MPRTHQDETEKCCKPRSARRVAGHRAPRSIQSMEYAQHSREELERENNQLREQQNGWQDRLQALLGRMEEV